MLFSLSPVSDETRVAGCAVDWADLPLNILSVVRIRRPTILVGHGGRLSW